MFRDMYKKANDDIRGDRAILDRAFLQAAQPAKKKSPVIKYSFIGTAVAAVVVLGAVFANPSVFTDRSSDLGKYNVVTPTENVEVETNVTIADVPKADDDITTDEPAPVNSQATDKKAVTQKVETVDPKKENVPSVTEDNVNDDAAAMANDIMVEDIAEDDTAVDEYGIATMSLEDEEEGVYEQPSEEAAVGFTLRESNVFEEDSDSEEDEWVEYEVGTQVAGGSGGEMEAATETSTEESTDAVEMFSYMYDKSIYAEGEWGVKTEGFMNTDVSPVTNGTEAVERAKAECTVEYDATTVYHDPIENMWKVNFFMNDVWTEGGDETVYMNSDGVTQMIVYGE